jgi:hypothetical protein
MLQFQKELHPRVGQKGLLKYRCVVPADDVLPRGCFLRATCCETGGGHDCFILSSVQDLKILVATSCPNLTLINAMIYLLNDLTIGKHCACRHVGRPF